MGTQGGRQHVKTAMELVRTVDLRQRDFEPLFQTGDQMRDSMDASEYKYVALGLIFLKYISDAFAATHATLSADDLADPEGS